MITLKNIPLLLLPQTSAEKSKVKCLMAGPLPIDLTCGDSGYQYWLCDIILIPTKKYRNPKTVYGWEFADILHEGRWVHPDEWDLIDTKEKSK